jgi:hypothetical protein
MRRTPSHKICELCQRLIAANGLAMRSHMRAHVRAGSVRESVNARGEYRYFVVGSQNPPTLILRALTPKQKNLFP